MNKISSHEVVWEKDDSGLPQQASGPTNPVSTVDGPRQEIFQGQGKADNRNIKSSSEKTFQTVPESRLDRNPAIPLEDTQSRVNYAEVASKLEAPETLSNDEVDVAVAILVQRKIQDDAEKGNVNAKALARLAQFHYLLFIF